MKHRPSLSISSLTLSWAAAVGLLGVLMGPAVVWGQGGQSGAIIGNVFDQSGMPMSGIKITARSETQIGGARSVYSNAEGSFRFPALQPGTFEIRAEAPKLRAVIVKDVNVGISAAAEVNLVMEVETALEEVKVVERAPMVNTKSSAVKETIDLDMIESMPLTNRQSAHNQLIGMVAGATGRNVRGGTGNQTIFTQDGFDLREQFPTMKTSAAYEILTGGHGSDAPTASGGQINLVTRSGSNRFEGELNATLDSPWMRFFLDPGEAGNPSYIYQINPMISGPILKDRLWYFFNMETFIFRNGRGYDPAGVFPARPDGLNYNNKGMVKLTWQATTRNRLSGIFNFDSPHERNRKGDLGVEPEAQEGRLARRMFGGLIWDSLLSDNMVLRSQAGVIYYGNHIYPAMCLDDPQRCDFVEPVIQTFPVRQESQNSGAHNREDALDIQFNNRLEWFLSGVGLGEHAIQVSSQFFTERNTTYTSTPGDASTTYNGTVPASRTIYYSNDPRLEEERFGWYIQDISWQRHTAILRDQWRPTRHLTVTGGISHVWAQGSNSAGDTAINNSALVPSLSAAWDATHDGRTVLRGSFSNYADVEIEDAVRHSLGGRVQYLCRWNEGGQRFDNNCEYSGGASGNTIGQPCGPTGIDSNGQPCLEKLGIPRTQEYTLGAEREIVQGVALSLDGMYRRFNNQYDTRETNRLWNGNGTALSSTAGFRNGRNQTVSDFGTPDYARRRYMGLTLGARKREGRFKIQGSYTLSQLKGAEGSYSDNPAQDPYLYGYLGDDHRHEIKALVQYSMTSWLSTGIRYDYHSGYPYNRLFRNAVTNSFEDYRAPLGISPGTNINDPGDDRELRLPDVQSFNVQVRFNLLPLIRQRLDLYVDVLNVLALRTVTGVTQNEGPNFGLPSGRQGPMRIRLGLNYRY
jgi:hypothetical protein